MSCDLFIFAGEHSGDLHGEKLLQEIRAQHPGLKISGVGGPRMRAKGMDCVLPMEAFQVMGFIDVFLALPKLIRQFYFVAREIQRLNPKVVVTIDYPGFNLRLAKHLKKKGFPGKLVHFICPSVWAWGKKRIPLMAENLDKLLSILPFEEKVFEGTRLPVKFVGHPLSERLQTHAYKTLDWPTGKRIIALFPGSRKKEIERNLSLQLDICRDLLAANPDLHVALSISDEKFRPFIVEMLKSKQWSEKEVTLISAEHSYELMEQAHLAIAKSGTVTLELALHRTPTVVVYAVSKLDKIIAYDILRIRLTFYCLVNIIAQREVFPELIGPHFTRESGRKKAEELLTEARRSQIQSDCEAIRAELSGKKTSEEAASEILKMISIAPKSPFV
jgi:lipid-A-disaccharide synthase